jgi:hypothetical protein
MIETNVNVTGDVFLDVMIREGGLIDQLKSKVISYKGKHIRLVLDNAPAHQTQYVKDQINNKGKEDGWNNTLHYQIAQSPDTNTCNLAFFAIQV